MEKSLEKELDELRDELSDHFQTLERTESTLVRLHYLSQIKKLILRKKDRLNHDLTYQELLYNVELDLVELEEKLLIPEKESSIQWTFIPEGISWSFSSNPRLFLYQVLMLGLLVFFNIFIGGFYFNKILSTGDFHFMFELKGLLLIQFIYIYLMANELDRGYFGNKIQLLFKEGNERLTKKFDYSDDDSLVEELLLFTIGKTTFLYLLSLSSLLYSVCCFMKFKIHLDFMNYSLGPQIEWPLTLAILIFLAGYIHENGRYKRTRDLLRNILIQHFTKNFNEELLQKTARIRNQLAEIRKSKTA